MKGNEVMIWGEMCVLSLIYINVATCRICVICCLTITGFSLLFYNTSIYVFKYSFVFVFCFVYLFSILCILCFCNILCIVSLFVYICLFPIFAQVFRPLPPGGKLTAINKYHIISHHN